MTAEFNNSETNFVRPDLGAVIPHLFSKSFPIMIIPPLGPLSVLCVVVVTTSQYGIGEGCKPAATRPEGWAISAIRNAPTSVAISRNFSNSICRG